MVNKKKTNTYMRVLFQGCVQKAIAKLLLNILLIVLKKDEKHMRLQT
jgi:hypothetical protein